MKRITRPCVVLLVTILVLSMVFLEPLCATAKKITITFAAWEHESLVKVLSETMNRVLEKENPNIRFKYLQTAGDYNTKVSTMIAGGTPPDLLFVYWTSAAMWAEKGAIVSLNNFLEKEKVFNIDDLIPSQVKTYTYKGNLMAVPYCVFPWLLYYNKDEFDKVGLAYPDASWSWRKEFLDAAKKLTQDLNGDGKTDIFGYIQGMWFNRMYNVILGGGGDYFSPDGKKCILDQPEAYEGIQFITDLIHKYHVMPTLAQMEGESFRLFFQGGRAAMYYSGYFVFERVANETKFRWGIAPIPKGKIGRPQFIEGEGVGVVRTGKHRNEAWEVAKLFAHPEVVKRLIEMNYSFGPLKEVMEPGTELNNFLLKAHEDILGREGCQILMDTIKECTKAMPQVVEIGKITRIIQEKVWDPLLAGKSSAKEACREAALEINKILQK